MTLEIPREGLQLRSLLKDDGTLEVSLESVPTPDPAADEVTLRVDAAPINPSDLGILFAAADMASATFGGTVTRPIVTAKIPARAMPLFARRVGQSLPVGNEGAGVVVRTGSSDPAKALLGKSVAALGGAMFSQYRTVKVEQCLPLLPGTTAAEGASAFVNPLTSLAMLETMRREGHTALVHTAAASNLGLMLNRLCTQEKVGLVNVVRKEEQVAALAEVGATHVVNSSAPSFEEDLTAAVAATGATLAFDAVGGGKLASQILTSMEAALNRSSRAYSLYGSTTHKQVYIYGGLDLGLTEITRGFGMAWGVGGWLVLAELRKLGPALTQKLKERVAGELGTTFASRYSKQGTLAEMLSRPAIASYRRPATGEKFLILPNQGT
jgi:NADPH2:quinone reductase